MDGFKNTTKIKYFKDGGSVCAKSKPIAKCSGGKMKEGGKADIAQDKAIVKKAFTMHDKQEHAGEKTDLSKLRKGGRTKKSIGTVKKFKVGGEVTNVYEAKKSSGDKDNIKKVKLTKPAKAAAPSKASTKPAFKGSDVAKEKSKPAGEKDFLKKVAPTGNKKAAAPSGAKGPDAFKCGGKAVKKYAGGKEVLAGQGAVSDNERKTFQNATKPSTAGQGTVSDYERNRMSNISKLDPAQQAEFAKQQAEATAKYGVAKKKGGKIKKFAEGGFTSEEEKWLGGADRTDPIILARMRAAMGEKKPAAISTPAAAPSAPTNQIDDESQWGNVTPAQQKFNSGIAGSGVNTPAAPISPAAAPAARPATSWAGVDEGDRLRARSPAPAVNVEQDSGVAYPQGRDAVSSLRNSLFPSSGGSTPSAFPAQKVAPRPAQTIPSASMNMPSAFPAGRVASRPVANIPSANMAPMSLEESLRRKRAAAAPVVAQKRGGKAGKKGC